MSAKERGGDQARDRVWKSRKTFKVAKDRKDVGGDSRRRPKGEREPCQAKRAADKKRSSRGG